MKLNYKARAYLLGILTPLPRSPLPRSLSMLAVASGAMPAAAAGWAWRFVNARKASCLLSRRLDRRHARRYGFTLAADMREFHDERPTSRQPNTYRTRVDRLHRLGVPGAKTKARRPLREEAEHVQR
jgi:hypothetical protein